MTSIAQGATTTVTLAVGETVSVASNGGRWWTTVTPLVGPVVGPTAHLTQTHRSFGPLTGGGTVAITNQTVDTLVYVQTGAGVVSAPLSTPVGSSVTANLGDQGSVAVANPSGYWSATVTPSIGAASTMLYGPLGGNIVFGPYAVGAVVVLTNQTGAPIVSVASNAVSGAYITGNTTPGSVLTANLAVGAGTATSWQWTLNGTNISGQTAQTYTLLSTDPGNLIGVKINGGAFTASIAIPGLTGGRLFDTKRIGGNAVFA